MWKTSITLMTLLQIPVLVTALHQEEPTPFDAKGYPPDMRPLAVLTTSRCAKCHSMKRVLRSRTSGEEWADTVEMMRDKPRSGITKKEGEKIASFLAAWSTWSPEKKTPAGDTSKPTPDKAPDEALFPRTSHTIAHTGRIGADMALPMELALGSTRVVVDKVQLLADGTVTADVQVAGRNTTLKLPATGSGVGTLRTHVMKTWKVGQHPFRLELALTTADRSTSPRPGVRLATVVVRPDRIPSPAPR